MSENNEYKFLTAHFFKATQKGQINSLWKFRSNPGRIDEYKKALAAGHCKLEEALNRGQVKRMTLMGITVPENLKPVKKEKPPKVPKVKRDPNEIRLTNKQVARLKTFGVNVPEEMLPLRTRKKETPVAETPVAETPVAETPVAETPVAETPVAETPSAS